MPGVHDFTNYIKRGFGRGTVHASMDVRTGLMNREEGLKIAKEFDSEEPNALNYYLEATGHSKEEFYKIMLEKRMIPIKDITPEISESKHQGKNIRPFVIDFIEETRKEADEEKKLT